MILTRIPGHIDSEMGLAPWTQIRVNSDPL